MTTGSRLKGIARHTSLAKAIACVNQRQVRLWELGECDLLRVILQGWLVGAGRVGVAFEESKARVLLIF